MTLDELKSKITAQPKYKIGDIVYIHHVTVGAERAIIIGINAEPDRMRYAYELVIEDSAFYDNVRHTTVGEDGIFDSPLVIIELEQQSIKQRYEERMKELEDEKQKFLRQ